MLKSHKQFTLYQLLDYEPALPMSRDKNILKKL